MNTELLVCKKLTAGVVFSPYQLHPNQVNKIYAEITERYPFQSLQHLPDGARMSNPNCDFFIQTNRLQVNDSVEFFHSSKERAIELMIMAQSRLNIPVFNTFGVKINAFLPMTDGRDAASVLEDTVFKSAKNSLLTP